MAYVIRISGCVINRSPMLVHQMVAVSVALCYHLLLFTRYSGRNYTPPRHYDILSAKQLQPEMIIDSDTESEEDQIFTNEVNNSTDRSKLIMNNNVPPKFPR